MPKKKLPKNKLKVQKCLFSMPTIFTSCYFQPKRHSILIVLQLQKWKYSSLLSEYRKKTSLSHEAFDWQLKSNLSAFIM